MTDEHGTSDDDGRVLTGGVPGVTSSQQAATLASFVDGLVSEQQRRDDYLAGLLPEAERTCDYRSYDEAAADVNASASEDLDRLLDALRTNGIGSPLTITPDTDTDVGAASAETWAAAGYTTPEAVARWTEIGIDTPIVAQQWTTAGFTAESAALWVEVHDMTPSEAASCATVGFTPVDVERIRRADPGWTRPEPDLEALNPGWGIAQ